MNEPEDIFKLRVFGYAEHVGHAWSEVDYKGLTAVQLAYLYGLFFTLSDSINKELEERFDADRAYLLEEFGKLAVSVFTDKVKEEKAKIAESEKDNKLKRALDFFINKYVKPEEDS